MNRDTIFGQIYLPYSDYDMVIVKGCLCTSISGSARIVASEETLRTIASKLKDLMRDGIYVQASLESTSAQLHYISLSCDLVLDNQSDAAGVLWQIL